MYDTNKFPEHISKRKEYGIIKAYYEILQK